MTAPLIDIAVNLTASSFDKDRDEVIARAQDAGVTPLLLLGSNIIDSERALTLVKSRPGLLLSTAGIHPHDADTFDQHSLAQLRRLLAQPGVVAVGECGLDFNRDYSPRPAQEQAFEAQLQLAAELQLPVVMHQRDAHERFMTILGSYRQQLPAAVLHCFTGSRQELIDCLELDLHIGITGWICDERRGHHLKALLPLIPDNRLMLETDAPYLLPRDLNPKPKSRRNEPMYLPHIAKTVADARQQTQAQLMQQCRQTTIDFFQLNNTPVTQ